MNKINIIFINSQLLSIRYWKNNYLVFWFHKPVRHLSRLYITKFELCGKQLYFEDMDDLKIFSLFKQELYEIDKYANEAESLIRD